MKAKLAVLVGCNYRTSSGKISELHGCINDAHSMHHTLITRLRFNPRTIETMTDDPDSKEMPTGKNIKAALERMFDQAKPGDVLLFYFAGHGTIITPKSASTDKPRSAIVPLDLNLITCADFRKLVNRLPKGATFMFLADSCHSGGLIDQEKEQIGPGHTHRHSHEERAEPTPRMFPFETVPSQVSSMISNEEGAEPTPRMIPFETILSELSSMTGLDTHHIGVQMEHMFGENSSAMFRDHPNQLHRGLKPDQGVLISGCQPNEYCGEDKIDGKICGLFSYGLQKALKEHPRPITNKQLVLRTRQIIGKLNGKQHPCLYSSDKNALAIFLP